MAPYSGVGERPYRFTQSGGGYNPTSCATFGAGGTLGVTSQTNVVEANDLEWSSNQLGGANSGSPQSISNWLVFNNGPLTGVLSSQLIAQNNRAVAVRS